MLNKIALISIVLAVLLIDQGVKQVVVRSAQAENASSFIVVDAYYNQKNATTLTVALFLIVVITLQALQAKPYSIIWYALGFILGGGVSNAIDMTLYRAVVDILRVGDAYINIADMSIVLGVIIFCVQKIKEFKLLANNSH